MTDIGVVPFRQDFRDPLLLGAKTATTRTRRLGEPGDTFWAFGVEYVLQEVVKKPLDEVALTRWKEEGCTSASDFIRIWTDLHPRNLYDGSRRVWFHRFEKVQ